jgi:hypothetical protein
MIKQLRHLPEELGTPDTILADAGFYSAANVQHCDAAPIQPLIARRRDQHYLPWYERITEPAPIPESADAVEQMLHRLKKPAARAFYGLCKPSVEPAFGIIKQAMRFRQFLLRGKAKVTGEWQLVSLAAA